MAKGSKSGKQEGFGELAPGEMVSPFSFQRNDSSFPEANKPSTESPEDPVGYIPSIGKKGDE